MPILASDVSPVSNAPGHTQPPPSFARATIGRSASRDGKQVPKNLPERESASLVKSFPRRRLPPSVSLPSLLQPSSDRSRSPRPSLPPSALPPSKDVPLPPPPPPHARARPPRGGLRGLPLRLLKAGPSAATSCIHPPHLVSWTPPVRSHYHRLSAAQVLPSLQGVPNAPVTPPVRTHSLPALPGPSLAYCAFAKNPQAFASGLVREDTRRALPSVANIGDGEAASASTDGAAANATHASPGHESRSGAPVDSSTWTKHPSQGPSSSPAKSPSEAAASAASGIKPTTAASDRGAPPNVRSSGESLWVVRRGVDGLSIRDRLLQLSRVRRGLPATGVHSDKVSLTTVVTALLRARRISRAFAQEPAFRSLSSIQLAMLATGGVPTQVKRCARQAAEARSSPCRKLRASLPRRASLRASLPRRASLRASLPRRASLRASLPRQASLGALLPREARPSYPPGPLRAGILVWLLLHPMRPQSCHTHRSPTHPPPPRRLPGTAPSTARARRRRASTCSYAAACSRMSSTARQASSACRGVPHAASASGWRPSHTACVASPQ